MDKVKQGNFLDHLTKGLYDAVVQAQALAENQHIEALSKYVNEDGTPKCMRMVINGENVMVPLATLAPQSSIKIKELTMDLKVKLTNFGKRKSKSGGGIFKKQDAGAVSVDLANSILPGKNNYANLKITFEGTEPPEGVVRLNNHLIKQIP
jgi:hypothetical protein|tara:strand:+ start:332 stop:784 length:453 start_codon:yes stop_codon:yes gene_type:complete